MAVAVLLALAFAAHDDARGLWLVLRAADMQGALRRVADLDAVPVTERLVWIPSSRGSLRARVYQPVSGARQVVLLVSGLNPAGLDEPRLHRLARTLAESRVVVVTPEIPELSHYQVTAALTDRIEEAALWLARDSGLSWSGQVGLIGISFSGGLALVAAARPALRNHVLYVLSFGGHDSLGRVLEYYCTGLESGGWSGDSQRMPHDYGAAVVLLTVADQLVPPDQVEPLRDSMRRYLNASYLDRDDAATASREQADLRDLAAHMPEPSGSLLRLLIERDMAGLGRRLRPFIRPYATNPALSPALAPAPAAPVFLLHGRSDSVIPAGESVQLADRLRTEVPVELLVTDVISHAAVDRPARISDVLRLAHFWGAVLAR